MLGSLQEAVQAMDSVQAKAGEMFSLYHEAAGELQEAGNILSQAESELQSQADSASDSISQAGARPRQIQQTFRSARQTAR